MAHEEGTKSFGKLRNFLWPIYRSELIKFVPMFLLFFLISFNYHLLRITKDALVITAPQSGAEILPFLKVFAILPSAIILTFMYTRLANIFSREKIFYAICGFFLLFFLGFLLFIYPHKETLYCNGFGDWLQSFLPVGFKGFIAVIRYWMFSLYYIFAEGWSTIMLSLLLWGFANDVTSINEAKRFYAMFGVGINIAGIFAGLLGEKLSRFMHHGLSANASWDHTITLFVIIIIINGIVAMAVHRYLHVKFFTRRRHAGHLGLLKENDTIEKKEPKKMSLRLILKDVLHSPYLLYLSLIVLCYNMVINFTEVLWKSQVHEAYHDPGSFTAYMSNVTFYVGILATVGSLFISGNILRLFGWKKTAYVTPIMAIVTGIGFFYFLFNKVYFPSFWMVFGAVAPLTFTVLFGSLQNIFLRSCKYTVFDATKEMAFIPLDPESRIKGKSAIDGIGTRLGKSGSSLILQILLLFFATPIASAPIILLIMGIIIFPTWLFSIKSLNKKFQEVSSNPQSYIDLGSKAETAPVKE